MKTVILLISFVLSIASFAQSNPDFSFTPTDSSGFINLSADAQVINIVNKSNSEKSMSLSSSSSIFSYIDRCSGKSLKPHKSCYIIISPSRNQDSFMVDLNNNGTKIVSLKFTKLTQPDSSSISLSKNSINLGTITKTGQTASQLITVTNTGSLSLSPIITSSSKAKIVLNRCSTLKRGASCSVLVAVDVDSSLVSSSSLAESISIKPTLTASPEVVSVTGTISVPSICGVGKHKNGNVCEDDNISCSNPLTGIKQGINHWGSTNYTGCQASVQNDCYLGFTLNAATKACDLVNGSVLQTKHEPDESLLAIPNQNIHYTNQADFGRMIVKFTLPTASYVNSYSIKISKTLGAIAPVKFAIYRVDPSPIYTIDNCCILGSFDTISTTVINSATLVTFSKAGGILLPAGDYYIMEEAGLSHNFDVPLYYSPPNVSASVYGQEWLFGYKPAPVYSGGNYVAFNVAPKNYAPYFNISTTPYTSPIFLSSFTPDNSKLFRNENSVIQSNVQPPLTMKIRFTVTNRSYIYRVSTKFVPNVPTNYLNLYFNIYKDNLGTLGQLVASSTYSGQFGSPSAPDYNVSTVFTGSQILEAGDYWIMDNTTVAGVFPLFSTVGRANSNKVLFYTCEGTNFMYGPVCGTNFESAIYGVPVSPYFNIELQPF